MSNAKGVASFLSGTVKSKSCSSEMWKLSGKVVRNCQGKSGKVRTVRTVPVQNQGNSGFLASASQIQVTNLPVLLSIS